MGDVFKNLVSVDVNGHTEKKNNLTYLSWSWAWSAVMERYPEATYEIKHFDGRPYLHDENLGYMVETSMTIEGLERSMWLPVMDVANKAMKDEPYIYKVKEYKNGKWTGGYIDKTVEVATMFDINTAIMRCLVKNIAMFGLGLYIYSGEDLPPEKAADAAKLKKVEELCAELNVNREVLFRKYRTAYKVPDGGGLPDRAVDAMIGQLEGAKEKAKNANKGKPEGDQH